METKFNFKSQICTTRSQSEALLKLGLKPETADMCSVIDHVSNGSKWEEVDTIFSFTPDDWNFRESVMPRWSLHRLLSLIPREFEVDIIHMYGRNYKMPIEMHILPDLSVIYTDLNKELYKGFYYTNIYDSLISCIEWQIEQGYFNKEYLV